jgi:uncharacterized membrane protein
LQPFVHGGADAAGGGLVGLLDKLLEKLGQAGEPGGNLELLPGIQALGPNIHPYLVHFPIALLSLFFLLEILGLLFHREGLRQTASTLLYCGTLGAIAAVAAGLYAATAVPHDQTVHDIMEWHERLGLTVASLATILSIWRLIAKHRIEGMAVALHLFLGTIMTASMIVGADLGGLMVYGHGVAVRQMQDPAAQQEHIHGTVPQADNGRGRSHQPSLPKG